ncbi:MSC_0882 family membrane protein [Spiroplasma endosymbiont of Asaphidion curtum]|uniref:MSC_0882 family membrane protein n=1 Tax=Spiroplasma endosymbiont of Asaphidion curtum TaxID=3066281 RepID=UPI00313BB529
MSWKEKIRDKFFNKVEQKRLNDNKLKAEQLDPYFPYERKQKQSDIPRVINRYEFTVDDKKYFNSGIKESTSYYEENYNLPKARIYTPKNDYSREFGGKPYQQNATTITSYQYPQQPILDSSPNDFLEDNHNDYSPTLYQKSYQEPYLSYNEPEAQELSYRSLSLKTIPKEIANEVRSEKYRLVLTMIIGFLGIISSSIPLILWFLKHQNIVIDNENLIPHPTLMIPLCIVSLGLFFISLFDWIKIKKEVEGYLKKAKLGNNVIPNFIIANYRKMHIRSIIINWVAFPLYIIGAMVIAILYGLSGAIQPKIFGFLILDMTIRDLTTEIIILTGILFALFFLQVLNIIFVRKRKANIIGFYGYEIINPYEMYELKRAINRRCLWIWLTIIAIIFFVIAIPIWLLRRKKIKVTSS